MIVKESAPLSILIGHFLCSRRELTAGTWMKTESPISTRKTQTATVRWTSSTVEERLVPTVSKGRQDPKIANWQVERPFSVSRDRVRGADSPF